MIKDQTLSEYILSNFKNMSYENFLEIYKYEDYIIFSEEKVQSSLNYKGEKDV